jgi:hypothetical protein
VTFFLFCFSISLSMPKGPVIIITGTPGTGKSTHAQLLVDESPVPLTHINVGEWVKEKGWFEEFDQEWQSYTVDEDKVGHTSGSGTLTNIFDSCWMNSSRWSPPEASFSIGTPARCFQNDGPILWLCCDATTRNCGSDWKSGTSR